MAIGMPTATELPKGARRALVKALHELYTGAGCPSTRDLEKAIDRADLPATVGRETLGQLLSGRAVPDWLRLETVVRHLAAVSLHRPDVETELFRFHALWRADRETAPIPRPRKASHDSASADGPAPSGPSAPPPRVQSTADRAIAAALDVGALVPLPPLVLDSWSGGSVRAVALSPDGALMAVSGGSRGTSLWDTARLALVNEPWSRQPSCSALAFSPDGKLLAGVDEEGMLRLWNRKSDEHAEERLLLTGSPSRSLAFSPDGALLAIGGADGTVRLWDVAGGAICRQVLLGRDCPLRTLAFSPDGSLLAASGDDLTVRVWDTTTLGPACDPLTGHTGTVWSAAFSPCGSVLGTAGDHTVRLWDPAAGQATGVLKAKHFSEVRSLAFSPRGSFLAAGDDSGMVHLWNQRSREPQGTPIAAHAGSVLVTTFTPDGSLLITSGVDRRVRRWVAATP